MLMYWSSGLDLTPACRSWPSSPSLSPALKMEGSCSRSLLCCLTSLLFLVQLST
ncbi:Hypothetical predicted protein, partial [Marmota monax]